MQLSADCSARPRQNSRTSAKRQRVQRVPRMTGEGARPARISAYHQASDTEPTAAHVRASISATASSSTGSVATPGKAGRLCKLRGFDFRLVATSPRWEIHALRDVSVGSRGSHRSILGDLSTRRLVSTSTTSAPATMHNSPCPHSVLRATRAQRVACIKLQSRYAPVWPPVLDRHLPW